MTDRVQPRSVGTFSGGLDSTTLLYHLRDEGHDVLALAIDYGQRHRIELDHACKIAQHMGAPFEIADLRALSTVFAGSSQTDPSIDVPLGHYAEENMKQTVVPNRNMILLAVATAWAISQKADHVAYAAHAGDHTIYPDCRPEFADAMAAAIGLADWHAVKLIRPFVAMSKADIVRRGAALNVPFNLTWSCYQGGDQQCGACGTCIERREAFIIAGLDDPTDYHDVAPSLDRDAAGALTINWQRTWRGQIMPDNVQHKATHE